MTDLLLLAGTAEARALAQLLAPDFDVTVSLAGVTRDPALSAGAARRGGFGGAAGLADWLRISGARAVVDATHPFARQMPWNVSSACDSLALPRLRLVRPAWPNDPSWVIAEDLASAAAVLPSGARVLLTTGRGELTSFVSRTDVSFVLRTIEPVHGLPRHIVPLTARPPFRIAEEAYLLESLNATHLVTKNAGGTGRAKLDAAAELGLTVIMVSRPPIPPGPRATAVAEARDWVRQTLTRCRP